MLQPVALTDMRTYIKGRIGGAQYKVGSTWYDCTIVESIITDDGFVRIKCQISPEAACTITGARLLNTDSQVWATKDVSVIIETVLEHLLAWFDFVVNESEVS